VKIGTPVTSALGAFALACVFYLKAHTGQTDRQTDGRPDKTRNVAYDNDGCLTAEAGELHC